MWQLKQENYPVKDNNTNIFFDPRISMKKYIWGHENPVFLRGLLFWTKHTLKNFGGTENKSFWDIIPDMRFDFTK